MLIFFRNKITTPPVPTMTRNKKSVTQLIMSKAPVGKHTYEWWLRFFQTTIRDNWDNIA